MPFSASLPLPTLPTAPLTERELAMEEMAKQLRKQLLLKQFELDTVLSVAQGVTAVEHSEEQLYKMLSLTLQGQRNVGQVLLFAREGEGFRPRVSLGRRLDEVADLALPAAVQAHHSVKVLQVDDLNLPADFVRFEFVLPVLRQQRPAAYLFVGGLPPAAELERKPLIDFLSSLANTLIGAVENLALTQQRIKDAAVEREIEIAQQVQDRLFPYRLPNDAHLVVERSYVPHTRMGGDYYDVIDLDADRLLLCVADVSGKGVPASLLMSNFQAGLRTLLRQNIELATIVQELNHLLFVNSGGEKFITAFLGLYDRRTRRLQFVNAGHNDPLLLPDQGPAQFLKDGTVMLGIMDELPLLRVGEVTVPPRSLLFLYTDGLTEVFDTDGQEFGEEGVLDFLHRHRYLPLPRLHHELLATIRRFNVEDERFADDITILSSRFK